MIAISGRPRLPQAPPGNFRQTKFSKAFQPDVITSTFGDNHGVDPESSGADKAIYDSLHTLRGVWQTGVVG